jgi:hypothetical protein
MLTVATDAEREARKIDLELHDRMAQEMEERKRKNPPFVQLSENRMTDLRKHLQINPLAVEIFLFLSQHMGHDNIVICPTKVLIEETKKSRPTITKAINYLRAVGLVEVVKFGNVNGYGVSGEYVWKTFNHPGRYSVFENVKALASKSDNKVVRKKLAHIFQPALPGMEEMEEAE